MKHYPYKVQMKHSYTDADKAERFIDRAISFKTENIWSLYSPDLNPLDFCLWGLGEGRWLQRQAS